MSGKGRSVAALQKKDIFLHVVLKRTSLALSQEIYRQIESFAVLLCKAHSASYVESYQSSIRALPRRVYGGSYQQPRRIL
jgi:hypothetical protein